MHVRVNIFYMWIYSWRFLKPVHIFINQDARQPSFHYHDASECPVIRYVKYIFKPTTCIFQCVLYTGIGYIRPANLNWKSSWKTFEMSVDMYKNITRAGQMFHRLFTWEFIKKLNAITSHMILFHRFCRATWKVSSMFFITDPLCW